KSNAKPRAGEEAGNIAKQAEAEFADKVVVDQFAFCRQKHILERGKEARVDEAGMARNFPQHKEEDRECQTATQFDRPLAVTMRDRHQCSSLCFQRCTRSSAASNPLSIRNPTMPMAIIATITTSSQNIW